MAPTVIPTPSVADNNPGFPFISFVPDGTSTVPKVLEPSAISGRSEKEVDSVCEPEDINALEYRANKFYKGNYDILKEVTEAKGGVFSGLFHGFVDTIRAGWNWDTLKNMFHKTDSKIKRDDEEANKPEGVFSIAALNQRFENAVKSGWEYLKSQFHKIKQFTQAVVSPNSQPKVKRDDKEVPRISYPEGTPVYNEGAFAKSYNTIVDLLEFSWDGVKSLFHKKPDHAQGISAPETNPNTKRDDETDVPGTLLVHTHGRPNPISAPEIAAQSAETSEQEAITKRDFSPIPTLDEDQIAEISAEGHHSTPGIDGQFMIGNQDFAYEGQLHAISGNLEDLNQSVESICSWQHISCVAFMVVFTVLAVRALKVRCASMPAVRLRPVPVPVGAVGEYRDLEKAGSQ